MEPGAGNAGTAQVSSQQAVTIIGAGLAGSLMAILLGKRGIPVRLLERRPDLRKQQLSAGRSINLALADRGIHALKQAGVYAAVEPLLVAMPGRCVHDLQGHTQFVRYGQREHEVIYSISRPGLNQVLLDHAEQLPDVQLQFSTECHSVDFRHHRLQLQDADTQQTRIEGYATLIAADGSNSIVRQALISSTAAQSGSEMLPHGYKELTLPAGAFDQHQLEQHALHIWPRGGFMLIALPNLDGSFTVTLFLPFENPAQPGECFSGLHDLHSIQTFFQQHFPDALALMPNLAREFLAHPTGKMFTVRSSRWTDGNSTALIGDAAHAIVPFHGQGMNCAFEDCIELDALMQQQPVASAFAQFENQRKPNANAIADMALENYLEMRDTVRHPKFLLQKELSFELERRFPDRFIPRYSMVMFHHEIPYALAIQRGRIQARLLDELTLNAEKIDDVDLPLAASRIQAELEILAIER
jgi:kynurenine 3-monooxygenase